jgi:hypothetical protein
MSRNQSEFLRGGIIGAIVMLGVVIVMLVVGLMNPTLTNKLLEEVIPTTAIKPTEHKKPTWISTDTPIPSPNLVEIHTPSPAPVKGKSTESPSFIQVAPGGAISTLSPGASLPAAHPTYAPTDLPCQSCHNSLRGTP